MIIYHGVQIAYLNFTQPKIYINFYYWINLLAELGMFNGEWKITKDGFDEYINYFYKIILPNFQVSEQHYFK